MGRARERRARVARPPGRAVSGFGPPPGPPATEASRRPPAYLPPGGLPVGDPNLPASSWAGAGRVAGRAHRPAPGRRSVTVGSGHRPGIVSLRPMSLGDVIDGAVKHVRRNPGPVYTASLVVLLVATVPAALVAGAALRGSWSSALGADAVVGPGGFSAVLLATGLGVASLVLSGALSYSVGEAVLGRSPGLAEMWPVVRDRLGALVGLATVLTLGVTVPALLLVVLVAWSAQGGSLLAPALVALIGGLVVLAWGATVATRTCLAGSAVVLERRGVVPALRRSVSLTRGAFWRTFVRVAVVVVVCVVVFWVVQLPLLVVSALLTAALSLSPSLDAVVTSLGVATAALVSAAVVVPFAAGATTLLYVDQRMRLEGFDVVLQRAARRVS